MAVNGVKKVCIILLVIAAVLSLSIYALAATASDFSVNSLTSSYNDGTLAISVKFTTPSLPTEEDGNDDACAMFKVYIDDSEIMIQLEHKGNKLGIIHLIFSSDEGEAYIKKEVVDGELIVNVINFNEELGRITVKAIELGEINGKKLKMHIQSSTRGEDIKVRITSYTIFLEK